MKAITSESPAGSDYFLILRLLTWALLVCFYLVSAGLIGRLLWLR